MNKFIIFWQIWSIIIIDLCLFIFNFPLFIPLSLLNIVFIFLFTYKNMLLYYSLCWSLLPTNFRPISVQPLLYTPKYLLFTWIYSLHITQLVLSVRGHREHTRSAGMRGGGLVDGKKCSQMRVQNYSGARFIAPSRVQMLGPSPATSSIGDWGVNIRGSFVSMTSRPRLWSDR